MKVRSLISSNLLKLGHRKINSSIYHINGIKLYLCKNVFSPFTLTPKFLVDHLILRENWNVVEIGTGSGYIAIRIADRVKKIVAADINPLAVRCAKINVKLNNLSNKIEVMQSDLFSALGNETYDSIIFNPPYFIGKPKTLLGKSWFHVSPEKLISKFLDQAQNHLLEDGLIQLGYSNLGPIKSVKEVFREKGYKLIGYVNKNLIWEIISVLYYKKMT
ncbi:MAG: HemK2/MTQ2 family protein methyltransferase [Candidatus Hermodarchaeota archaeon]